MLFPSDTAKPFKADAGVVTASRFAGSTSNNNQMWAYLNGTTTTALNVTTSNQDKIDYGITSGVAGTTKSQADFRVYLKHSSGAVAVGGNAYFKLYFYQYSCSANAVGNGIASVSVDKAEAYDGDSVTFTATLKSGATFHGWFSDAACTQLISTSLTYTTAAADLTLYANATAATGTGIYIKSGGAFAEAQTAYRKISGAWVKVTDAAGLKAEMKNMNLKASN